ncbi:DUF1566 domain-containing protein [Pelotalea chapellei]|uniref:DUF1566 domain-containing protein n=1 Tax=Pelotalea chapellei TaxID=44671 RepID=A0ABS5U3B6_9BACT|nr:DUF1566 domain-containing protein [Pelotalea chapellei]MBT1070171.1 DUF1566 domain-containing protein [Pelotalea chapellei]
MRLMTLCIGVFLLLTCSCFAIEIKNAKATVIGSKIHLSYDLFGKPGERQANVKVAVVFDEERYLPGVIHLSGDYGSKVPVGKGKNIYWDLLKDMPAGFTGRIKWELDADPEISNDPFNMHGLRDKIKKPIVSESTVADPKTNLMWLRSPLTVKNVKSAEGAAAVVRKLNQSTYLGFSDWRLPKKDEFESLFKMIELYGYTSGQSALTYLTKIGFNIPAESKFWSVDKSSGEFSGREFFVSGTGQYAGSNSSSRSNSRSMRTTTNNNYGAGVASGSLSIKQRSEDYGLYDLIVDTKNGYFYKYNGSDTAKILTVRGNISTDIYSVNTQVDVSISP